MRVERNSKETILIFPNDDDNAFEVPVDEAADFLEELGRAVEDDGPAAGYASVHCRSGGALDLVLGGHLNRDDFEFNDTEGQTAQLCDVGVTRADMVACAVAIATTSEGDVLFGNDQPDEDYDNEVGVWRRVTWSPAAGGGVVILVAGHDDDGDWSLEPYVVDQWEQGAFGRAIQRVAG